MPSPTLIRDGVVATPTAGTTPEQIAAAKASGFVEQPSGSVYRDVSTAPTGASTPGRTYVGVDGNTYDEKTGALVAHGDISAVNEGDIRSRVLGNFQKEIDAQNQIYAEKLNEARVSGTGRLGSTRATQARSGLLGSDFAGAQNDKVTAYNTSIENSILAEKASKIAEIMGKATAEGTAQIAEKRKAQQAGLDEYVKFLAGRTEQRNTNIKNFAAYLLDSKIDPSEINPAELEKIATGYGISVGDLISGYKSAKTTRDAEQKKLDTEAQKTKFDQDLDKQKQAWLEKYQTGQISIDQYKAETDRLNALTNQSKAGLDANGNPVAGGASQLKNDALTSAKALLTKFDSGTGTSAVGGSRTLGLQYLPGTAPKDFEIQFNNLKSLLSLDNVKLLKGQGAVSDAERDLLAKASSKLDLAQSEPEFRSALADVITALSGATGQAESFQLPDGTIVHKQADGTYK